MPSYDTECQSCNHQWEQTHMMREPHSPCPLCRGSDVLNLINSVNVRPALDGFWEYENGGRGRYFPGMEQSVGCTQSPDNCFRSRNEALEACKRRGFEIIEK